MLAAKLGENKKDDEFGGYTKPWRFEKSTVSGIDGFGSQLTPQQIKTALKINQIAAEREAEFESIARQLGLNIEE